VIEAFNRDQPFDQFTLWQLAVTFTRGDLRTELATGFHRMTLSKQRRPNDIKEEYRVKTVKDD